MPDLIFGAGNHNHKVNKWLLMEAGTHIEVSSLHLPNFLELKGQLVHIIYFTIGEFQLLPLSNFLK